MHINCTARFPSFVKRRLNSATILFSRQSQRKERKLTEIDFSATEIDSGCISDEHLALANQTLTTDGFVVLKNIVDKEHIEIICERMLKDLETILARPDAPYNFNSGNVQQDPPPFPPYLFKDVLVNELVISVTKSILGSGLRNVFYSGNTALPGEQRQPVHADSGQLWPNLKSSPPRLVSGGEPSDGGHVRIQRQHRNMAWNTFGLQRICSVGRNQGGIEFVGEKTSSVSGHSTYDQRRECLGSRHAALARGNAKPFQPTSTNDRDDPPGGVAGRVEAEVSKGH